MEIKATKVRPKNLDLTSIQLPLPGIVSILHRVSGALLFLVGIPLLLSVLQQSLQSPSGYEALGQVLSQPLFKLLLVGLIWAFWHHFCAGLRFLLLDMHRGVRIESARSSSRWVLIVSLLLTILSGAALW